MESKLKAWCNEKRGNASKLAKSIQLPRSFITSITNGDKQLPPKHITQVSQLTGISPSDLRPDLAEIFTNE